MKTLNRIDLQRVNKNISSKLTHKATITHWRFLLALSGGSKTVNERSWVSLAPLNADTTVGECRRASLGAISGGSRTEVLKCSKLPPSSAGEISVRHSPLSGRGGAAIASGIPCTQNEAIRTLGTPARWQSPARLRDTSRPVCCVLLLIAIMTVYLR